MEFFWDVAVLRWSVIALKRWFATSQRDSLIGELLEMYRSGRGCAWHSRCTSSHLPSMQSRITMLIYGTRPEHGKHDYPRFG
jgi:hypothetical protein